MHSKPWIIIAGVAIGYTLLLILYYPSEKYPITRIDSFSQADQALATADADSLILFDLDDTLIEPMDLLARDRTPSLWFLLKVLFKYPPVFALRASPGTASFLKDKFQIIPY